MLEWLLLMCIGSEVARGYVINLDIAAEDRWKQIGLDYKDCIQEVVAILTENVPEAVVLLINRMGEDLDKLLPSPYKEELLGLSEVSEVPVGELFLLNLAIDLNSRCTSVVAQDTNGKVLHGRNLDMLSDEYFLSLTEIVRKMVITVHFQKEGETVYTGTTIAGMIGLLHGQKPNSFTISVNGRRTGTYWTNILSLIYDSPGSGIGFVIRDALADPDIDYQGVLNRMMYIPLISASYITIAGTKPGEGAVITRNRKEAVKPFSNGVWKLDADSGQWYLLQTNCDHWTAPPNLGPTSSNPDDPEILQWAYERETVGNEAMDNITQNNITAESMLTVLSTDPVLNSETLCTTVMSAAEPSLYQSWVRYPTEEIEPQATEEEPQATNKSETLTTERQESMAEPQETEEQATGDQNAIEAEQQQ